jgi:hypothetical protein
LAELLRWLCYPLGDQINVVIYIALLWNIVILNSLA